MDEQYDKQAAQILKDGANLLFKNGSKNAVVSNLDDGEDTDADIEDVLGEEEISSFVDFLQFAAAGELGDENEEPNNSKNEFLQFAAFATAASNVLAKSTSGVPKNLVKDEAYAMLPDRLTLQAPESEDENELQIEKNKDLENFFMTSNLSNKKFETPFLSLQPLQPTHNSTCLRK